MATSADCVNLDGLTIANIDLDDRELVLRVRERDLREAGVRIRAALRGCKTLALSTPKVGGSIVNFLRICGKVPNMDFGG